MTIQEETLNKKRLLEYLVRLASDGVTPLIEKQVIGMLDNTLDFFTHLVKQAEFRSLSRLTVNKRVVGENKRITEMSQIKYPPSYLVKSYGRCNKPGQSVLYACFDPLTAINEMKPEVGDLITTSTWRLKRGCHLTYCPIFRVQPEGDIKNLESLRFDQEFERELRKQPEFLWPITKLLVDFVAQEFSKRHTSKNHLDYVFSAYFSDKILYQLQHGDIEAIYYPSVQSGLTFNNIAVKPEAFDSKYELVEVHDSMITNIANGKDKGTMMAGLGTSKAFDFAGGKIFWPENSSGGHRIADLENWQKKYGLKLN